MSSEISSKGKYCGYCGRDLDENEDCTCKRSIAEHNRMARPESGSVVALKLLGWCPKCATMVTPMEITRDLKVECPNCKTREDYKNVKEGMWSLKPKLSLTW